MLRLVVSAFIIVLGFSLLQISTVQPSLADGYEGGGQGEDDGGGKEKKQPLYIKKSQLSKSDVEVIYKAIKDGRKVLLQGGVLKIPRPLNTNFWNIFMPYEPDMARELLNLLLATDNKSLKSLRKERARLQKLIKKLQLKKKLAEKLGTKTQVQIVKNMLTSLRALLSENGIKIADLRGIR